MTVKRINPILNVSNLKASFAWFEKLGWTKGWDWGDPPDFGAVCSGECEIFLCENCQGGEVWMSIWVDDVDAVHRRCMEHGIEVVRAPADMPWNVRETHIRHPDGHIFRVSQTRGAAN